MPYDKTMCEQQVAWVKEGHFHSKRVEQHFLRGLLIGLLRDDFNDSRSNVEPRVVIGPDRPHWLDLWKPGNVLHHFVQGIVTTAKVIEVIANPSAHVGEQMPDGDFLGYLLIADFEILDVSLDGRVQIHLSIFHKLHDHRA